MTAEALRGWRIRIFALTWFAYAGFYFCRKNFSVLMPLLQENTGITKEQLATAIFGYSLMYSIGQFLMGTLSDRFGSRLAAISHKALAKSRCFWHNYV